MYRQLNKEPEDSLLTKYVRIIVVVSLYWVVSILTVFVNKTLLSSTNLDAPIFIAWYQCFITAVICYIMKMLHSYFPNKIKFPDDCDPFDPNIMKRVLPLTLMFTSMIAANNLCLKYVSVAFYYIGRSLTTIFNVVFTYTLLKEKTSLRSVGMCVIIIFGFFLGVDQESLTGSFSLFGTIFGVLASLSLSLYSIYTKRVLPYLNNEVWLLSYYNNIYSCIFLIPIMIINGEFQQLWIYPRLHENYFWFLMTIGGVCGFAIGFLTTLQIKVTSPLTHNISGTAKACAQTVLATYWYQESKSFLWWLSNAIVLLGSAGYARIKQLDMEKKHQGNQNQKI